MVLSILFYISDIILGFRLAFSKTFLEIHI